MQDRFVILRKDTSASFSLRKISDIGLPDPKKELEIDFSKDFRKKKIDSENIVFNCTEHKSKREGAVIYIRAIDKKSLKTLASKIIRIIQFEKKL